MGGGGQFKKNHTLFGNLEVAQLLLDGGADMESCNNEGDHPLHLAAGAGNLPVLRLLLQVLWCNFEKYILFELLHRGEP